MEEYQIQDNEETLIETDYEVSEIFEGSVDSDDIEVADIENFRQQQTLGTFASKTNRKNASSVKDHTKRKYSFVWDYFKPIDGTNQFQCMLCQSSVGSQTSNLARHLSSTHDINKPKDVRLI